MDSGEAMDTKGGILFRGTSNDGNTVNQFVFNFNINIDKLDVEQLAKLKQVLEEIKGDLPISPERQEPQEEQKKKRRWC